MACQNVRMCIYVYFNVQYETSETIYQDQDLPSTDSLDLWAGIGEADADPKVDLYAALGYDRADFSSDCNEQSSNWECISGTCTCWVTKGVAFVGGACLDYDKTSMTEYSRTTAETAMVSLFK